jgi:hypothetical protein
MRFFYNWLFRTKNEAKRYTDDGGCATKLFLPPLSTVRPLLTGFPLTMLVYKRNMFSLTRAVAHALQSTLDVNQGVWTNISFLGFNRYL